VRTVHGERNIAADIPDKTPADPTASPGPPENSIKMREVERIIDSPQSSFRAPTTAEPLSQIVTDKSSTSTPSLSEGPKQSQDSTSKLRIEDQCAKVHRESTKTRCLPDGSSENGRLSASAVDQHGNESTATLEDSLSPSRNSSDVEAISGDIQDYPMRDSSSESVVGAAEEIANVNSELELPDSDSTSICSISMRLVQDPKTPSTILDDDMSDTEEEWSESDTSLPSTASSASIWPSTPNSAEREGLVTPVLDESRRQIVNRLMLVVRTLLNQHLWFRTRAGSDNSSPRQPVEYTLSGTPAGNQGNNGKRPREDDSHSEMHGDGSGDGNPSKHQKTKVPAIDDKPRKLACPYYKRNPSLHRGVRSCAGPGWRSCHRIKYDYLPLSTLQL
jgi:hypothetical protein